MGGEIQRGIEGETEIGGDREGDTEIDIERDIEIEGEI